MAISKIILNGITQMDLTSDTVAAANLIAPNTAHGADGEPVVGTASTGSGSITIEEVPNATGTTLQITTNGSGGGGSTPSLQTKSVSYTPTTSAQTATITADTGYDGLEQVNVSVGAIPSGYIIPSGTKSISENGTGIDVTNFATVDVSVSSGGGTPSATQHDIYFEFSDETNTTITAYYDDSFISNAITATTPTTYGNKTVTLAQLDGVTWYEVSGDIPLNTELVDYTTVMTGYIINESGAIEYTGQSWDAISDYIPIDPSMTFTFKNNKWYNVGFYNSSKNMVRVVVASDIETSSSGQLSTGTLNASNIPSTAAYIILSGNAYDLQGSMSLIRTA